MKKITYEFGVRLPLAKLLTPVKELEESINSNLSTFGVEDKLSITTVVGGTMEVKHEMTDSEIDTMRELIRSEYAKVVGSAKIEYFRRQSGNVLQSVTQ